MAAKKSSNSNKTAHVMNLLSRNRESASQEDAEQKPADPQAAPAPAQAAPSQVNSLMSSLHPDATVSAQIKSALEADLAEEDRVAPAQTEVSTQTEAPSQTEAPTQTEASAQMDPPVPNLSDLDETATDEEEILSAEDGLPSFDDESATQKAIAQGLEQLEAQEAQRVQPDQDGSDHPAPSGGAIQFEDPNASVPYGELVYVNVMQHLVEENAPKYMRLYGVCRCPRCQVDVKALALSGLPSKYVVMRKGEMVPRISVYEGRYSAAVTAQLLWACKLVTEKPHHGR